MPLRKTHAQHTGRAASEVRVLSSVRGGERAAREFPGPGEIPYETRDERAETRDSRDGMD